MIGIQVTKTQINEQAGNIALALKRSYDAAVSLNDFLIRTSNQELLDLGFLQGEIDTMKSAYADLAYQKATAFDSSTFAKELYGMGI